MRLLITGASGYLGGRIFQNFAERQQFEIRLLSRSYFNINDFDNVDLRCIDWKNSTDLEAACERMDTVIHLAGMNAADSVQNPIEAYEINVLNTIRLLEASVRKGVKKFIYFSTAHVYSNSLNGEFTEESSVKNFHPYAATHKAAEDIIRYYASLGKIDSYVLRLSNAYGPPVSTHTNCWSLLINDLCKQAVTDKKLVLKSNGLQKRDFISISDVIQALDLLLIDKTSPSSGKIFNLGGDWSISVWEMAQLIRDRAEMILGFRPSLERKEEGKLEDTASFRFNIEKIKTFGLKITQNKMKEIDDLLFFCKQHFQQNIES
ncbi:NAD(P)-dependent oxidoreductase [Leptospira yasudae]|nr:NAD(P)-dependent oxidoreductase [Leptospira yasudae]